MVEALSGLQQMNMLAVISRQMQDASVEGGEKEPLADRHAEQEGIGNLIMAMEPLREGSRGFMPVSIDWHVPATGFGLKTGKDRHRLTHGYISQLGLCQEPQEASFSEGAKCPFEH